MDRKKIIMVVLVIIFLISLVYRIMHPFRQESVTELTYVGDRVVVKAIKGDSGLSGQKASEEGAKVRIDLFLNPPRHKGKVIRNVFEATTVQKKRILWSRPNKIFPDSMYLACLRGEMKRLFSSSGEKKFWWSEKATGLMASTWLKT